MVAGQAVSQGEEGQLPGQVRGVEPLGPAQHQDVDTICSHYIIRTALVTLQVIKIDRDTGDSSVDCGLRGYNYQISFQ